MCLFIYIYIYNIITTVHRAGLTLQNITQLDASPQREDIFSDPSRGSKEDSCCQKDYIVAFFTVAPLLFHISNVLGGLEHTSDTIHIYYIDTSDILVHDIGGYLVGGLEHSVRGASLPHSEHAHCPKMW